MRRLNLNEHQRLHYLHNSGIDKDLTKQPINAGCSYKTALTAFAQYGQSPLSLV